jgi:ankyrin repeat protein
MLPGVNFAPTTGATYRHYDLIDVLAFAARENNVAALEMFGDDADFGATDCEGRTLLHIAARAGSVEFLNGLLKRASADVLNAVDDYGCTALMEAADAEMNSRVMVEALVGAGASVEIPAAEQSDDISEFGSDRSALRRALDRKNWEAAEWLIKSGKADIRAVQQKLMRAARFDDYAGYVDVCHGLRKVNGVLSPGSVNNKGQTIFHVAVEARSENFLLRLFRDMASIVTIGEAHRGALDVVDKKGHTALMDVCAQRGDKHVLVKAFLQAGASHNVAGTSTSAMELTYRNRNRFAAQELQRAGATGQQHNAWDVDALIKWQASHRPSTSELSSIDGRRDTYHSGGEQLHNEAGIDLHARAHPQSLSTPDPKLRDLAKLALFDKMERCFASGKERRGAKALMIAAHFGNMGLLQSFKENFLSEKDDLGRTAMFYAAEAGSVGSVRVLVKRGLAVNERAANGDTPFSAAVQSVAVRSKAMRWGISEPRLAMVESLIDLGADINIPDAQGFTPLMHAAMAGDEIMCQLLIERGADVHIRSNDGLSVMSMAHDSHNLFELLAAAPSAPPLPAHSTEDGTEWCSPTAPAFPEGVLEFEQALMLQQQTDARDVLPPNPRFA